MKHIITLALIILLLFSTTFAFGETSTAQNGFSINFGGSSSGFSFSIGSSNEPSDDTTNSVSDTDIVISEDELSSERWFDLNSDTIFIFDSNHEYHQTYGTTDTGGTWALNGNTVKIWNMTLTVETTEYGATLLGGEYELVKESAYPMLVAGIGEALNGENITARINDVEFLDNWPEDVVFSKISGSKKKEAQLSEGQCVVKINFTIMNLTKAIVPLSEGKYGDFEMAIDYRDGFIYSTDGPTLYIITDNNAWAFHRTDGNGAYQGEISVAPLEEKTVDIYIACPKILKDDTDSPLKVLIYETISGKLNILQFPIR